MLSKFDVALLHVKRVHECESIACRNASSSFQKIMNLHCTSRQEVHWRERDNRRSLNRLAKKGENALKNFHFDEVTAFVCRDLHFRGRFHSQDLSRSRHKSRATVARADDNNSISFMNSLWSTTTHAFLAEFISKLVARSLAHMIHEFLLVLAQFTS